MNEKVNNDTLNRLISIHRDDPDTIEIITDALDSFEKYHEAIYKLEIKRKLYGNGAMNAETYREVIPDLDSVRTNCHNALLAEVNLLNRLSVQAGLPLFYDGEVSGDRPIRTWVADAILEFVNQMILDRVTGGR